MKNRAIQALALSLLTACGGDAALEGRFVAVHNTLTSMGLAQTGPISEGSLGEGSDAAIEQELAAGECYTFVALGSSGVDDLDVIVLDESGRELARDDTRDRQAAAHFCPEREGTHQIVVRMTEGDGEYTISSWSGGVSGLGGGGGGARRAARGGGCESPIALTVGRPMRGTTQDGPNAMSGSCAEGAAPEQVYRLEVEERSQLRAVLSSTYDGVLYIMSACGDMRSELGCNDDNPDTTRSQLDVTLDPGEYFLVVDGYGEESGDFDSVTQLSELRPVSAVCGEATTLVPGQPASGTTSGVPNYFQATCAGGARSADRVYTLDVSSRSRMRLRQQSDHDGALYVRRACDDPTSEIACNDDFRDEHHSLITTVVDPGRYYVYADGYGSSAAGNFTLSVDLTSESGGGAQGDACAAPASLQYGQQIDIDTIEARDDYAGSCGGQAGPDVVYELSARARSRVTVNLEEVEFPGAIYLQRTCGDANSEVACEQITAEMVAEGQPVSLDTTVGAGTYYLVIDGARADTFGAGKLTVQVADLAALNAMCRRAPRIRPGQPISGSTVGESNDLQATCAGGAQSNDMVYRLTLPRRQIVRASLETPDYDGALYILRNCGDATSEIACNDDEQDNRHSLIETTLDAGTYYVVVDGFRTGNAGPFTLDVQTSNP